MAAYRSLAAPSPCRGCPKWHMDRDHILIAVSVHRLFALMLVLFSVIYALPKDLELLRPPLRLALLVSALVQARYRLQLARHLRAGVGAEERG